MLRRLLGQAGLLTPGARAGLISVPRVDKAHQITVSVRSAILTHELSHGEYFTNPAYVDQVHRFWVGDLTEPERDAMRKFLASEGYDISNEELLENEMQAYLMFTVDPAFFAPSMAGLTAERRDELRALFLRQMQDGWLRNVLAESLRDAKP
jgi:hypothetical protein